MSEDSQNEKEHRTKVWEDMLGKEGLTFEAKIEDPSFWLSRAHPKYVIISEEKKKFLKLFPYTSRKEVAVIQTHPHYTELSVTVWNKDYKDKISRAIDGISKELGEHIPISY